MFAYIGSRTTKERNARGEGVSICHIDDNTGELTKLSTVALINPSYLAISQNKQVLYTIHGDRNEVSSFAINQTTGELTFVDSLHCGGKNPVHLTISPDNDFLIVCNHLTGNLTSIAIDEQGNFGRIADNINFKGQVGPHRIEQPFAKPHFSAFDSSGKFIIVPDKGLDCVFCVAFDKGKFNQNPSIIKSREGAGPRHFIAHPSGQYVYVVNELDSTIATYQFDNKNGQLTPIQVITTLDSDFVGNNRCAGIMMDNQGKYVYASNRGADCVSIFAVNVDTFKLTPVGFANTQKTPRFITLNPDGNYLYALNEDSDSISQFKVNQTIGQLTLINTFENIGSPVCMVFLT